MPAQATNTDTYYKTRDDFYWGINHHHEGFNCYPEAYLEQRINLIARAGCNIIRINGYIDVDMTYLDQVVGLCNKYGLKIIMTYIPELDLGLEYIELSCKSLAERYNGKDGRGFVDYIQVWNETDAVLLTDKNGTGAPAGKVFSDYFTIPVDGYADLPEYTEYFKAAAKGIHEAESDTKFMINFCYKHWGSILWFLDNGVKIDAIGWDSYGQSTDTKTATDAFKQDCEEFYADVVQKYNIPVIITETNTTRELIPDYNATREIGNYKILLNMIELAYQYNWIKGLIVYELLDEPNLPAREANWGMVDCSLGGIIGEVKPIYSKLQQMLGGNDNTPVLNRSVVDLQPYERLKVDTADDSQIGKNETASSTPSLIVPETTIPDIKNDDSESSAEETKDNTESRAEETKDNTESRAEEPKDNSESKAEEPKENSESKAEEPKDNSESKAEESKDNSESGYDELEDDFEIADDEPESIATSPETIVKKINVTQTTYEFPWLFTILVGIGILLVAGGAIVVFLVLKKRKAGKSKFSE